jgi:hypothetical protein
MNEQKRWNKIVTTIVFTAFLLVAPLAGHAVAGAEGTGDRLPAAGQARAGDDWPWESVQDDDWPWENRTS